MSQNAKPNDIQDVPHAPSRIIWEIKYLYYIKKIIWGRKEGSSLGDLVVRIPGCHCYERV